MKIIEMQCNGSTCMTYINHRSLKNYSHASKCVKLHVPSKSAIFHPISRNNEAVLSNKFPKEK